MIYTDFQDKKLSQLGFGTMRLPMADGVIDEAQVADMVRLAMENGVNYFDTAWPYHGGESERVIGRVLAEYPRESWYLATKYPGHQISSSYDPAAIFEEQLCKWPIILLLGVCAAILLYCRLAWIHDRADCVCSVLTNELEQHEIDDRVRAICDCNSSGTHLLVQMTCEHGVRIQLQVFPDNGFYWGKRLRGDN